MQQYDDTLIIMILCSVNIDLYNSQVLNGTCLNLKYILVRQVITYLVIYRCNRRLAQLASYSY